MRFVVRRVVRLQRSSFPGIRRFSEILQRASCGTFCDALNFISRAAFVVTKLNMSLQVWYGAYFTNAGTETQILVRDVEDSGRDS